MPRCTLFLAATLILVAGCGEPTSSPAPAAECPLPTSVDTSCPGCAVRPVKLTRAGGPAQTETLSFAGDPGADYVLDVAASNDPRAQEEIVLNGAAIAVPPRQQDASPRRLHLPVRLRAANVLTVRLLGQRGTCVTLMITGGVGVIDGAGGSVTVPGGDVRLDVPPGALPAATEVRVVPAPGAAPPDVIEGVRPLGPAWILEPGGTFFDLPVTVSLRYGGVLSQAGSPDEIGVVHWEPQGAFVEAVSAIDDPASQTLTVTLDHFSNLSLVRTSSPAYSLHVMRWSIPSLRVSGAVSGFETWQEQTRQLDFLRETGPVNIRVVPGAAIHADCAGFGGWYVLVRYIAVCVPGFDRVLGADDQVKIVVNEGAHWNGTQRDNALIHMIGHAVGLGHAWRLPDDFPYPGDEHFPVMTVLVSAGRRPPNRRTALHPVDVAAIQAKYGAAGAVVAVAVVPASADLRVGGTLQLTARALDFEGRVLPGRMVTWSAANLAVARVSDAGLVTGVGAGGPVTITATSEGKTGTATVRVFPSLASVRVLPGAVILPAGGAVQLAATVFDADGGIAGEPVNWASGDPSRAGVTSSGLVSAVAVGGPVTITASSGAVQGTAGVTVTAFPFASYSYGWTFASACGLTAQGAAFCLGANQHGQLGDGTTTPRATPTAVAGGLTFTRIVASGTHTCGLDADGRAHCWGRGSEGQLGTGSTASRSVPTAVTGDLRFVSIDASSTGIGGATCGLTDAGVAYCWGMNDFGGIGDGTTQDRASPVPVSTPRRFVSISVGYLHACGLTVAGEAFCWGHNIGGRLGDGTSVDRLVPMAVTGGLRFVSISAGGGHTCGLVAGGAAYCWGLNSYGELGTGDPADGSGSFIAHPAPVAVAGGHSFHSIAAGVARVCGLVAGGRAYCWGVNNVGQLGDGTTVDRVRPVSVTGGSSFEALMPRNPARTCALVAGGSVICWP